MNMNLRGGFPWWLLVLILLLLAALVLVPLLVGV
jgi:maltodextrin utilization protein YvdJ